MLSIFSEAILNVAIVLEQSRNPLLPNNYTKNIENAEMSKVSSSHPRARPRVCLLPQNALR